VSVEMSRFAVIFRPIRFRWNATEYQPYSGGTIPDRYESMEVVPNSDAGRVGQWTRPPQVQYSRATMKFLPRLSGCSGMPLGRIRVRDNFRS